MPAPIRMPALSPTMEEGTLAKWTVSEGAEVRPGDVIAEIETDKATMEVEAVDEGVLGKIVVPEGTANVKVNALIAVLLAEGESIEDAAALVGGESVAPPVPPEAAEGAAVQRSQDVGSVSAKGPPRPSANMPVSSAGSRASEGRVFASPLARRLARQAGLDVESVKGTGPHGRIVKRDVERALAEPRPSAPTAAVLPRTADAEAVKALYAPGSYVEVPLDGMRRTIAARLTESKQTVPHFYLTVDVELDLLLAARARANARLADRGAKLSVNDYCVKAVALALRDVPECNVAFAGDRLLRFDAVDVAVAVAVPGGLFTPVLRAADRKSLATLSAEMKELAGRARNRRLAPEEYQGGSIAVSNLGMYGIRNFDAVINPPHGSILALGAGEKRPVVRDEALAAATIMTVTLSVDHRAIDGALGAAFLSAFRGYVEDPAMMAV